jgi:hypothetical protein
LFAAALDPLRLTIALGPLAVYLIAIGLLNFSRRPTLVRGTRDTLATAIALSGVILVGPLELFLPMDAAAVFGPVVWLLLISFYLLVVVFIVLNEPPRLVCYNMPIEVLRPILTRLAPALDAGCCWAGDTLALPALGVELRLEPTRALRSVTLAANHERQSFAGWRLLEASLRRETAALAVPPNWQGLSLVVVALVLLGVLLYGNAGDPNGVAQSLVELLRI